VRGGVVDVVVEHGEGGRGELAERRREQVERRKRPAQWHTRLAESVEDVDVLGHKI
jgi:hypothetical protein